MSHYMTSIETGCECWYTVCRIPGEPHIPSYYDAEWNPDCPVHPPAPLGVLPVEDDEQSQRLGGITW